MTDARLQTCDRKGLRGAGEDHAPDQGRHARSGRGGARPARPRQGAGRGESSRRDGAQFVEGQPVAEEGGAAVLPAQRQCADSRRAGRRDLVGQGAVQIRGLGRESLPGRRLSRRSGRDRAPLGLCRPRRRPDAELRQSRRLCRREDHGRHLGHGRLLRADRQERASLRAASASAACSSRLQANPTIIEDNCFIGARSEVVEGVIVGEGSVLSMGVFISASTKIIDRATGKVHIGDVPPYSVVVPGSLARQAPARRLARPFALLRGDRQDGRRADAGEDRHQRAAARISGGGLEPAVLALAAPARGDLLAQAVRGLGRETRPLERARPRRRRDRRWRRPGAVGQRDIVLEPDPHVAAEQRAGDRRRRPRGGRTRRRSTRRSGACPARETAAGRTARRGAGSRSARARREPPTRSNGISPCFCIAASRTASSACRG